MHVVCCLLLCAVCCHVSFVGCVGGCCSLCAGVRRAVVIYGCRLSVVVCWLAVLVVWCVLFVDWCLSLCAAV